MKLEGRIECTEGWACFEMSEKWTYLWLVRKLTVATKKIKRWLRWNSVCNPHQLHSPIWAWHCYVYMATWYTNTPKSWKEREWSGATCYSLKSQFFNQVIFISSFVVRVHSFGLQRQVRKKWCSVEMVGEVFRNFCLACKARKMINGNVSLRADIELVISFAFSLLPLRVTCNFSVSWITLTKHTYIGNECHSGLWFIDTHAPSLGLTFCPLAFF